MSCHRATAKGHAISGSRPASPRSRQRARQATRCLDAPSSKSPTLGFSRWDWDHESRCKSSSTHNRSARRQQTATPSRDATQDCCAGRSIGGVRATSTRPQRHPFGQSSRAVPPLAGLSHRYPGARWYWCNKPAPGRPAIGVVAQWVTRRARAVLTVRGWVVPGTVAVSGMVSQGPLLMLNSPP